MRTLRLLAAAAPLLVLLACKGEPKASSADPRPTALAQAAEGEGACCTNGEEHAHANKHEHGEHACDGTCAHDGKHAHGETHAHGCDGTCEDGCQEACAHDGKHEHACGHEGAAEPSEVANAPADEEGVIRRGAPLQDATAIAISDLLANVEQHEGKLLTIDGTVRRNCTRKGCWMDLAGGMEAALPGARVTFKDYAFFVPLDSAGAKAKVQGTVEAKLVPADAVAHYESEGAVYPNKRPDGSAHEVRIVATGVELRRN
jgi:hypothetical protein